MFCSNLVIDVLLRGGIDGSEDGVDRRSLGLAWLTSIHGGGVLWRGMSLQPVFVLQFHLGPMKLNQIWLHRGTCEDRVSLLCLTEDGIIFWPFSVSACLEWRSSIQFAVVRVFWCISTTFKRMLLQAPTYQQDCSAKVEVQRRQWVFAHSASPMNAEGRSYDFLNDPPVISYCCKEVFVRVSFT